MLMSKSKAKGFTILLFSIWTMHSSSHTALDLLWNTKHLYFPPLMPCHKLQYHIIHELSCKEAYMRVKLICLWTTQDFQWIKFDSSKNRLLGLFFHRNHHILQKFPFLSVVKKLCQTASFLGIFVYIFKFRNVSLLKCFFGSFGTVVLPFPSQSSYYFKVTKSISRNDVVFPEQRAASLTVDFVLFCAICWFLTAFR